MPCEYWMTHRVEFAMTDMAGIMHFSNFFRMMEVTEHAFFRSVGLSIHTKIAGRTVSWPRVHTHCDYKAPLRFEEMVEVRLLVRSKRSKALEYEFQFWKPADPKPLLAAVGSMTVVCAALDENAGKMRAIDIPEIIASQIEAAPPEFFEK